MGLSSAWVYLLEAHQPNPRVRMVAPQILGLKKLVGVAKWWMTYSVLIDCYCKSGEVGEGFSLLEEMEREGLKADVFVHSSLISAFCGEEEGMLLIGLVEMVLETM